MSSESAQVRQLRSVARAARGGDERALLVALRDRVADAIDSPRCSGRDLVPLVRLLSLIRRDLKACDLAAGKSATAAG